MNTQVVHTIQGEILTLQNNMIVTSCKDPVSGYYHVLLNSSNYIDILENPFSEIVPDKFKVLEWIASTDAKERMNTGIYLGDTVEYAQKYTGEILFEYIGTKDTEQWLCGAMTNDTKDYHGGGLHGIEGGVFSGKFYNELSWRYTEPDDETQEVIEYRKNVKTKAIFNSSTLKVLPSRTQNRYIGLFYRNYYNVNTGEDEFNEGLYKVYSVRFYKDNELLYNLVPARTLVDNITAVRDPNPNGTGVPDTVVVPKGTLGMYDAAKDVFLVDYRWTKGCEYTFKGSDE